MQGNVFANMVRGLGTHNFSGGRYHTRIAVVGNTFTGMRNDAMRVMNWRDSAIIGNTFDGVWCPGHGNDCRGILASGAENLTVKGNVFANMARAIQFMPWANDGRAAAYGVTYNALTDDQPARPRRQQGRVRAPTPRGDHQPGVPGVLARRHRAVLRLLTPSRSRGAGSLTRR